MLQRELEQYWQKVQSGQGFFWGIFLSINIYYNFSLCERPGDYLAAYPVSVGSTDDLLTEKNMPAAIMAMPNHW
jgi:hypothetical protein